MNFEPGSTFTRSHILEYTERDHDAERLALRYLDKWAPDLVGVILGGVL